MVHRNVNAVVAVLAALAVVPLAGQAQVAWETECVSQKIELPGRGRDAANVTAAEVQTGKRLKFRFRFFRETYDGKSAVHAGAVIDNQGKRPMYYGYSVAFFDAENKLIGTASKRSGATGIAGNGSETVEDCRLIVPLNEAARICSVQIRVYESELPIGEG